MTPAHALLVVVAPLAAAEAVRLAWRWWQSAQAAHRARVEALRVDRRSRAARAHSTPRVLR